MVLTLPADGNYPRVFIKKRNIYDFKLSETETLFEYFHPHVVKTYSATLLA